MNDTYDKVNHLPTSNEDIKELFTIGNKLVTMTSDGCVVIKQRDIHNPKKVHTMYFMAEDLRKIAAEV